MIFDELGIKILEVLSEENRDEMRFKDIRNKLWKHRAKDAYGDRNLLSVKIVRRLRTFQELDLVKKRILSPKRVFYALKDEKTKKKVLAIIIRHKKLTDLKDMPIDFAADLSSEYAGPLALEDILPKTLPDAKPLNTLQWIDLCSEKITGFLPQPKLKYAFFHQIGREVSPSLKWILSKYRFTWLLERLISEILSSIVVSVYHKDPRFIEKISELIEWYRDAINQRFKIVVDFDGKSIAEEVDWEELKRETVRLGEEWNRHWREAYEKSVEEGLKRREEFKEKHPEEYEEWIRKLYSEETLKKLDEFNLRMMIYAAIMSISSEDFRTREEAIQAVIDVLNDKKRLRQEGFPDAFHVSLEGIDLKQAIEDYLSAVDKHPRPYKLWHRKYRYPGTDRVYDLYRFSLQPRKQLLSSSQKG